MRASLRAEYGVRDIRGETVADLSMMVAWLPPGCALWRSVGGPLSWSEETHWLVGIEYRLRYLVWMKSKDASSGRNRPADPQSPAYTSEKAKSTDAMERKAAAHRRRQRPPN